MLENNQSRHGIPTFFWITRRVRGSEYNTITGQQDYQGEQKAKPSACVQHYMPHRGDLIAIVPSDMPSH